MKPLKPTSRPSQSRLGRSSLPPVAAILLLTGFYGLAYPAFADDRCQLQLSEAVIDYGAYTRTQPTPAQRNSSLMHVGKRTLSLSATCSANTVIALTFKGERSNEQGYRFSKNGLFTLKVTDAQLDGRSVSLRTPDAAQAQNGALIRPGEAVVPYAGTNVTAGRQLTVQIEVETLIDLAGTRVNADEEWEGSGHFEITPLTHE